MPIYHSLSLLIALSSPLLHNEQTSPLDSTAGYEKVAQDYDKGRPDYPQEIIRFLTTALDIQPGTAVLDLAAGTGKVTKALKPLGVHLCAVEPVAEMRAVFSEHFPEIAIFDAAAENIPLPSESVDVVIVGTAFHWFDGEKALAEIARVLKQGGKLGLIWNVRATEVGWVREVYDVLEKYEKGATHDKMQWRGAFEKTVLFGPLSYHTYRYSYPGDAQDVLSRVFSAKLMGKFSQEKREEVALEVLNILANHPDTKEKKNFDIPYRVEVYWCQKPNPMSQK